VAASTTDLPDLPQLVALTDVADWLDTTPGNLRKLSRRGKFPPIYGISRRLARVRKDELGEWFEGCALKPIPAPIEGEKFPGRGY
jgi:hypothetical protein